MYLWVTYFYFSEFASIPMENLAAANTDVNTPETSANRQERQSQTAAQSCPQSRSQHVTTVKVFVAVFLLYLFSYLPSFLLLSGKVENFFLVYTYFLNHVGNSICYYVINREFRKDVHSLFCK